MKVSNPQSFTAAAAQSTQSSDSSATTTQNALPMNIFSTLITQTLQSQPDDMSDAPETDVNPDLGDQAQSDTSAEVTDEDSLLLTEITLLNQKANVDTAAETNTDINADTKADTNTQLTEIKTTQTASQLLQQNPLTLQPGASTATEASSLNNINMLPTPSKDTQPQEEKRVSMTQPKLPDIKRASLNLPLKPIGDTGSKGIFMQSSDLFDSQDATSITVTAAKADTQLPLSNSLSDKIENKFQLALSQLGVVINQQVQIHLNNSVQTLANDIKQSSVTAQNEVRSSNAANYAANIELIPPSISALMKESYDAKIKIYPPELGHVTAKLKVNKNSAELLILTENPKVKEIVEASLTKLRESFQNNSIQLTTINVESSPMQTRDEPANQQQNESFQANTSTNQVKEGQADSTSATPKKNNSLIDTYA